MTRLLVDGRGRRWICSQGGIGATDEVRRFRPAVDEITPAGLSYAALRMWRSSPRAVGTKDMARTVGRRTAAPA